MCKSCEVVLDEWLHCLDFVFKNRCMSSTAFQRIFKKPVVVKQLKLSVRFFILKNQR